MNNRPIRTRREGAALADGLGLLPTTVKHRERLEQLLPRTAPNSPAHREILRRIKAIQTTDFAVGSRDTLGLFQEHYKNKKFGKAFDLLKTLEKKAFDRKSFLAMANKWLDFFQFLVHPKNQPSITTKQNAITSAAVCAAKAGKPGLVAEIESIARQEGVPLATPYARWCTSKSPEFEQWRDTKQFAKAARTLERAIPLVLLPSEFAALARSFTEIAIELIPDAKPTETNLTKACLRKAFKLALRSNAPDFAREIQKTAEKNGFPDFLGASKA